jgi:hypothetical protein
MSLPLVIDIALGVIFIYLILSLLASEIHELLTTVMQWRADHLKRSIHLMLDGGSSAQPDRTVQATTALTDRLYNHPLINTLNHEATGQMAVLMRKLSGGIVRGCYAFSAALYAMFGGIFAKNGTKPHNPFAQQTSAPSYIPADTFAQTVIETFELSKIGRLVTLSRLEEFKRQQLKEILRQVKHLSLQESHDLATDHLRQIARDYEQIMLSFAEGKTPLYVVINQMGHTLAGLVQYCETFISLDDAARPYFLYQLSYLHDKYYREADKPALIASLKPDLHEILNLVRDQQDLLQELRNTITDTDSQVYKSFNAVLLNLPELPPSLQQSLNAIATNVKQQSDDLEKDLQSLQGEIESWFDKSMTRASGVYKRNARGIAILIGFLIAVATNADTLFIVDTLSHDSVLRATVSEFATSQVQSQMQSPVQSPGSEGSEGAEPVNSATPEQLNAELDVIKENVRQSLDDVSLPLGWDESMLTLQAEDEWTIPMTDVELPWVKRVAGWSISAIAISMGASFWYDLLRKVLGLKVGNSGGEGVAPSNAPSNAPSTERRF